VGAARAFAHAVEWVLPRIPPSWQTPLSEVVGTIAFLLGSRQREAVRSNLVVMAKGRPLDARRVFVNQVRQYLEVFQIPRLDRARFEQIVRVDGWENFECARAKGKGVIFGSAHLGPVALVGQYLMTRGYTLTLPAEPTKSELMEAVNRARQAQGLRLVPVDSAFGIHRVMRRGGVLGFLADRAVTGVGERVRFFGRDALLPSAHVAIALRTGAALVPAFTWREDGMLRARIEKPLDLVATGDRDADVRDGVRRFAEILERYVSEYPEQWTVFEPVWRAAEATPTAGAA
jgi:KDO2-lipid IV(A) lauroyltransferase